jgi:hypothetical protein
MPHKFKIGTTVNYHPKDRMLSTARGTYTITRLMPATEGQEPEGVVGLTTSQARQLLRTEMMNTTAKTPPASRREDFAHDPILVEMPATARCQFPR